MLRRAAILLTALSLCFACDGGADTPDGSTPTTDGSTPPPTDGGGSTPDAQVNPDGGGTTDPDGGVGPSPSVCADRTAEIVAATGPTITVSPAGDRVMVDGEMRTLHQVVSGAAEGTTILLEDGTYTIPEASGGGYSGLYFTTPNVTLRSASGDASAVILDSAYRLHGGQTAPITVDAAGVVLSGFTVRRSVFHLIHLWKDADDVVIHDVHMIDGGQQFLKASPGDAHRVDRVEVSCSRFVMTDEGRDNVWGYGSQTGNTRCYTGGIDTHESRDWHVHDSYFEGIYCTPDGPRRPVHGRAPDARGGMTYTGGLSEHAIHMWDSDEGSGHLIERNHIVDCARGIGIGFRADVYGSIIRNNMIFSRLPAGGQNDVGISVERSHDTMVLNNTVFYSNPEAYSSRMEYRYGVTSGLVMKNNLTNGRIRARDGASADLGSNVTEAEASWFVDATGGDLHLASCDVAAVVGAGESLSEVTVDIDGDPRGDSNDIGADDCAE